MKIIVPTLLTAILFCACNTEEIGKSQDVNPDAVYMEYRINDSEVSDEVSLMARFRFAGAEGTTLLLSDSEYVSLDGKKLSADSTKSMGVYYEAKAKPSSFQGEHKVSFSNRSGKEFTNAFHFPLVRITSSIPQKLSAKDVVLQFSGVTSTAKIDVHLSDTAGATNDIELTATGKNEITIPQASLAQLKPGPVTIDVLATDKISLKSTTPEGGEMIIYHDLKARKAILQK